MGAILCQGSRQISSILRIVGKGQCKQFGKYHRVLNQARWNSLFLGKILLSKLLFLLPSNGYIIITVDDTLERRWGRKIKAKGCYRDAVRSSHTKTVTCFGLKWVVLSLIVTLPWNKRPWALPFLTVLAPSKKSNEERGRSHKTVIDLTILTLGIVSRWLGKKRWILLGDGAFACLRLAKICQNKNVVLLARFRLDSCLYEEASPSVTGRRGRKPLKGARVRLDTLAQDETQPWSPLTVCWYQGEKRNVTVLTGVHLWYKSGTEPVKLRWVIVKDPTGTKRTEAFFSTDVTMKATEIIELYVLRWNTEVTFAEARSHLGMETQRQWSDKAISRTTPLILGLFSLVCLMAIELRKTIAFSTRSTAWYVKNDEATFSDILAFVRRAIWSSTYFNKSTIKQGVVKIKTKIWETLLDQLADTG